MSVEKSRTTKKTEFLWTPGDGPSSDALKRLARICPKPSKIIGEAWFLGDKRRIFTELERLDVENIPHDIMAKIFWEMTGGVSSFGREDIWNEWFYYLLGYLLEKENCACGANVEYLVSAALVMNTVFPDVPYPQYKNDLRDTLGRAIMSKLYWSETGDLTDDVNGVSSWSNGPSCCGPVSASLFLCLEFLEENQIDDWIYSILRINGIYWRTNLLCWMLSAHNLLFIPDSFCNVDSRLFPSIQWEHDYLVTSAHVRFNRQKFELFFEKLREQLDLARFMLWMEPLFDEPSLAGELNDWSITDRYADYVLTGKKY